MAGNFRSEFENRELKQVATGVAVRYQLNGEELERGSWFYTV